MRFKASYLIFYVIGTVSGIVLLSGKEIIRNVDAVFADDSYHSNGGVRGRTALALSENGIRDYWIKVTGFKSNEEFLDELLTLMTDVRGIDASNKLVFLIEEWGRFSPKVAIEELKKIKMKEYHEGLVYKDIYKRLYKAWGRQNPEELAQYYLDKKGELGVNADDVLMKIIDPWSENVPEQALKWLSGLNELEQGLAVNHIMASVFQGVLKMKIKDAVEKIPESYFRNPDSLKYLMKNWVKLEPQEAKAWMQSLPDEQRETLSNYENVELWSSYCSMIGRKEADIDSLVKMTSQFNEEDKPGIWKSIFEKVVDMKGVNAALDWEDEVFPKEYENIMDPTRDYYRDKLTKDELVDRVEKSKSQEEKNRYLNKYTYKYGGENYKESLNYLISVNSPNHVEGLLYSWSSNNMGEAEKWLSESQFFSEEEKEKIRNIFEVRTMIATQES